MRGDAVDATTDNASAPANEAGACAEGGDGESQVASDADSIPMGLRERMVCELGDTWETFQEMGVASKVAAVLEAPFMAMRIATVPMTSREEYVKPFVLLSLALAPLWLCLYLGEIGGPVAVVLSVLAGGAAATGGWFAFVDGSPPTGVLGYAVAGIGFFVAATWIDVIANELVAVLSSAGVILGVDQDLLGLTVLAWGNSIGDLSTNIAMAKKGLGNMSMTACFAGPVFNMLVGLSLGVFAYLSANNVRSFPVTLDTKVFIGMVMLVIYCLAVVVVGLLPFGGRNRIPREFGYFGVGWYALYILFGALLVAGVIR